MVARSPVLTLAPSLSPYSGGLVSSDVIPGSVMVAPDSVHYHAPPANSDVVQPLDKSWSRVVKEVTIEYQWKLVRCSTCRKVGHSFCQPKKMYKATGRVLPLPPSLPTHAIKNPSSPKELVKENYAAISTSNSFEILREEDDLSNLGNSVTQIDLPSEICQADFGRHDAVHNDLEKPSTCANADTSLVISSGTPICYEDMAIKSASLGTLSVCPCSNEPEGGPPGRSTRSRKAKRSTDMSSSFGKSVPLPGNAWECHILAAGIVLDDLVTGILVNGLFRWLMALPAGMHSNAKFGMPESRMVDAIEVLDRSLCVHIAYAD
ncbi:hypothetical protein Nepgr_003837 [Nepenthes gracilis]|uniref:Uncharacterized protein n=1 Tax=Nepenthes gracilis TaxID=150966 RepID=A0AAD3S0D0_NEPGR|nr:hypothetical protein Nepgr_003837 [Nepenthes gracilis]